MLINKIFKYLTRKSNNEEILFTVGYEGLTSENFAERLKENNVKVLVDVREIPWSRKIGFSKSQLEDILNKYRIKYLHMQKLGSPSIIRKKVKENADYEYFFNKYKNHLKTQSEELKTLQKMIKHTVCCLMCYERDVEVCHRKIIVEEISRMNNNGLKIIHL